MGIVEEYSGSEKIFNLCVYTIVNLHNFFNGCLKFLTVVQSCGKLFLRLYVILVMAFHANTAHRIYVNVMTGGNFLFYVLTSDWSGKF